MDDPSFKVVLIGGASVGKTAIFDRLTGGVFDSNATSTISAHFLEKTIPIPNTQRTLRMQLWDTAGHERFKSVNRIYYRDACAAIVVCDITRRETFTQEAVFWMEDLKANAPSHCVMVLAGNKMDLMDRVQVTLPEMQEWAAANGIS